jgi:7-cyano-7-deazaguanine tRNA-ribosyltransferase
MHITSMESLGRPEVVRHVERLFNNYEPPRGCVAIVLPGEYLDRPYARDSLISWLINELSARNLLSKVHVVINNPVLGPIPYEISEIYPLSQHEYPQPIPRYLRFYSLYLLRRYLDVLVRRGFMDLIIITVGDYESRIKSIIDRLGPLKSSVILRASSKDELYSLMTWVINVVENIKC